jgi:hypothetical protein
MGICHKYDYMFRIVLSVLIHFCEYLEIWVIVSHRQKSSLHQIKQQCWRLHRKRKFVS